MTNPNREHLAGLELALSIADTVSTDSVSVGELMQLIAQAKGAPQAEPVATYMGTDWAAQSQFMAECASLEPGTELFAHRPAPVAELVRQCITDELAEWTGDNRVIIEHAMRDLTARIDAKLAQLRTKGE
jgi:hypothetical protein